MNSFKEVYSNNIFTGTKINELMKIRVGIVNYLNTKPLIYGLERSPIKDRIELIGDYPSRLADMLIKKEIDIGLIPVAVIPDLPGYHIIGDYCIGTEGEIASVALFSEVPITNIKRIYLDYQSRSSVELLKYLIKEYWGIRPELIQAENDDYRKEIKGTTAGLVIGDRAFEQRKISTYIFDLGSEWKKITGLPFVFATWVSIQQMEPGFIDMFNQANALGIGHIEEIVSAFPFHSFDLKKYFSLHLSYLFDERKKEGMQHFLQVIGNW
ncbi:MAG: menaquinone biosynthetic enzyme MqnA/MqnD family protein [Chitinophagaceae bacterium]